MHRFWRWPVTWAFDVVRHIRNAGAERPSQIGAEGARLDHDVFGPKSGAAAHHGRQRNGLHSRVLSGRVILSVTKVVPLIVRDEEKYW